MRQLSAKDSLRCIVLRGAGGKAFAAQAAGIAYPAGTPLCISLITGHRQPVVDTETTSRDNDLRLAHVDQGRMHP